MSSFLKNMGLMTLSILLTLGMLEVAVRVMRLGTGGFWEPNDQLGWVNIPNANGWESCYGECQVQVSINSLGMRDTETTYEKEDGQQRILFLGDSITAGMQVPLEDTFTEQLEDHLADAGDWEVLNGAVNGYGTDNELLYYRLEGHKFDPDVVVVGIYLANDIYNNSRVLELRTGGESHKPYFTFDNDGELVLNNFPVENTDTVGIKIGTFLKKHFQLPRFIAQTMSLRGEVPGWLRPIVTLFSGNRGVRAEDTSEEPAESDNTSAETGDENEELADQQRAVSRTDATICDEEYTPEIEEAWAITKAVLLQLKEEVEESGAELAVVSVPTTAQTITPRANATWYCERPNQELNTFLEEEDIPYLDLLQPFRDYSDEGGRALYYARDFHMNEAGHHLAGEEIFKFIDETFLSESE
ncbi:MAG: SGNH/GDSL hydrolase family protein [Chloroflexota bacterium]